MSLITTINSLNKEIGGPSTLSRLAKKLFPRESDKIIGAFINNKKVNLSYVPEFGVSIKWIRKNSADGLEMLNNSCCYLLASSIKRLFTDASFVSGHIKEKQFCYDFEFPISISERDLI